MSELDKEAEREKLRAQYEKEEEARKATAHMSELLLKGATMTNKHCETCGDPIFRYQGQSFCPTCQTPVTADADGASTADSDTTTTAPSTDAESSQPGGTDATQATEERDAAGAESVPSSGERAIASEPATPAQSAASRADLSAARDSLIATLNSLTARAEATDDVAETRKLLHASKDAAEALAAVESLYR